MRKQYCHIAPLKYLGTTHRKYLAELANCIGKSYWRGKIWQISYSQCLRMSNTLSVCRNIGEENFWQIHSTQFANFPLANIFRVQYSVSLITSLKLKYFPSNSPLQIYTYTVVWERFAVKIFVGSVT